MLACSMDWVFQILAKARCSDRLRPCQPAIRFPGSEELFVNNFSSDAMNRLPVLRMQRGSDRRAFVVQ